MENKKEEKTPRESALQALKEGNSVVLDGVTYTLRGNQDTGARSMDELPGEEFFVKGNEAATAKVVSDLLKQKLELEARLAALEGAPKEEAKAKSEEVKSESKKDDKKEDK